MAETYEDIVRKWYTKMRGEFTTLLLDRYRNTNMRLADAENIYQDVFLAIHRNLQEGRIKEDCDWSRYIIRVGLNMANKLYRTAGRGESLDENYPAEGERPSARAQMISEMLRELAADESDAELYNNPEVQSRLGEELIHTPEPCASIIRMSYYSNMTDAEIAATLAPYRDNGKPLAHNARAVKARRWLCMRDLVYRVKTALYNDGLIDQKPEKPRRHGHPHH